MFQQITLIGNLGRDPEMRYTPSGTEVADFSMATSRRWTKDGETQEETIWWKVTCWGRLASTVSEHLAKGRQVMVLGEVKEPTVWQDREGNHRTSLEVTARVVNFLGNKSDAPAPSSGGGDAGYGEDIPF